MTRVCGTCTLCCKLQGIEELRKVTNCWCAHARPGSQQGCAIYAHKPPSCTEYSCLWLRNPDTLGDELRPDRTGALFEGRNQGHDSVPRQTLSLRVAPENYEVTWRKPVVWNALSCMMRAGYDVWMTDSRNRSHIFMVDPTNPKRWRRMVGTCESPDPRVDIITGAKTFRFDRVDLGGPL